MSKKKDLYLTETFTIHELNKKIEIGFPKDKKHDARKLLKAANGLFFEGQKLFLEGDEEHAYIVFMRYLDLIEIIKGSSEFEKDKAYFSKMMGRSNIENVMDKCEKLNSSLKARYEAARNSRKSEKGEKSKSNEMGPKRIMFAVNRLTNKVNESVKPNSTVSEAKNPIEGITVVELKDLIVQNAKVLILDCRPNNSFSNNHLKHPNCVSIPEDAIVGGGNSVEAISETLRQKYPESFMLWNNRESFDTIVLQDWKSSSDDTAECLQMLYDFLTKGDSNKCRLPVILQGGMRCMYYWFPALFTNPTGI